MHLEHKIPWNSAVSQFKVVRENHAYTPHQTDFFASGRSSQDKILAHFSQIFISILDDFAATEKKECLDKGYATRHAAIIGDVISDAVRDLPMIIFELQAHDTNSLEHNAIGTIHQSFDAWKRESTYGSSDGDLADVVKTLIVTAAWCDTQEDQSIRNLGRQAFASLLQLSGHPHIPLSTLNHISWGHSFGIEEVVRGTLFIYLFINLVEASNLRAAERGHDLVSILDFHSFRTWTRNNLAEYDYPSQNLLHWKFWGLYGVSSRTFCFSSDQLTAGPSQCQTPKSVLDPSGILSPKPEHLHCLRKYTKACFGILFRYNILLVDWYGNACAHEFWREEIKVCFTNWRA